MMPALKMLHICFIKTKINALPVVDDDNKLCGIITDSDIFRAFVDIMGLARTSTRITIDVTDKSWCYCRYRRNVPR